MIQLDARVYRRLGLRNRRRILFLESRRGTDRAAPLTLADSLGWNSRRRLSPHDSLRRVHTQLAEVDVLAPEAGAVVGHGEGEQEEEEEYGRDDDQLEQFFVSAFEVHKEESDQQRFGGGDDEGDGGVEAAEVD